MSWVVPKLVPGKTAAFLIPMIERLAEGPKRSPRGLILAPTRELAFQIQKVLDRIGRSRRIFGTTRSWEAMICMPRCVGSANDLIFWWLPQAVYWITCGKGPSALTELQIVVLDEADRMLDMGFAPQLNQILDAIPDERQTLLFSATMPTNLGDLARMSLKDPVRAMVVEAWHSLPTASPILFTTRHHADKTPLLHTLLREPEQIPSWFLPGPSIAPNAYGNLLEKGGHRVAVSAWRPSALSTSQRLRRFPTRALPDFGGDRYCRTGGWMLPTLSTSSIMIFPMFRKTMCIGLDEPEE